MLSLFLFLIGILGFILNRKNIILMIISIEIMLLSITLLILMSSLGFNDITGQTFSIYIIAVAGAEAVIGLSILVAYYRFITSNFLNCYNLKKIYYFYKFLYPKNNSSINSYSYPKNTRFYSTSSFNHNINMDP